MSKEDVYYNHSEVPTYICTKWSADPKGGPATPEHTIYVGPGQGIDVTVLGWSKINPKCVETESSELIEDTLGMCTERFRAEKRKFTNVRLSDG